jgi:hypothetical protein
MRDELENKIIECLRRIYNHHNLEFNYENLEDVRSILNEIEPFEEEVKKSVSDLLVLWESFIFIRTDKMLMLKARDVWKMEMDTMKTSLESGIGELESLLERKEIQ